MARIDIEDLEEDREIKNDEMKKAFGGFGFSSGTSIPSSNWMPGTDWQERGGTGGGSTFRSTGGQAPFMPDKHGPQR